MAFDSDGYQLVESKETCGTDLGLVFTEREAALEYDRVAILLYGADAETTFPPEESENVGLSDEVMRQITDLRKSRGWLH